MLKDWLSGQCLLRIVVAFGLIWGWTALAQAMPARVIIIRHAEKYETPRSIHLSPKGRTLALALVEFFQSDPRLLKLGLPEVIIAQSPAKKNH